MRPSPRRSFSDAFIPGWHLLLICFVSLVLPGPASAYVIGERVIASRVTNVRNAPAGSTLGARAAGDGGVLIGGPVTASLSGTSYIWWQVDWDSSVDGWTFEGGLSVPPGALVYGIDVSRYQGSINWPEVYAEGIRFAFCKASDDTDYVDPQFTANAAGGRSAGVLMGMYHFARPERNPTLALQEARHFAATIRPYLVQGNLRPVLDLENGGTLGRTELSTWARTFCQEVERLTLLRPIIYANPNYAKDYLTSDMTLYPLWVAAPNYVPGSTVTGIGAWPNWTFQQYSWTGRFAGIGNGGTDTDLDAFRGTLADLTPYQIPLISQSITAASLSPGPAVRGTRLSLTISTTATHARPVLAEARLFRAGTSTPAINDAAHEGPVTLPAGNGNRTRFFDLPPTMAAGLYDLWVNLYLDVNANGFVDSGDTALSTVFKKSGALTVTETQTYATWAAALEMSGSDAAADADPDKDGAGNLAEYAFATQPTSSISRPVTTLSSQADGSLDFTFLRPLDRKDVTWIIQHGTGLDGWMDLATATGDLPFTTPGVRQTGTDPVQVSITWEPGEVVAGFFRVKVTKP